MFGPELFDNAIGVAIVFILIVIPIIGTVKVERDIAKHLQREQARLAKLGRTYITTGQLRLLFIWLVMLCLFAWALFSLAAEGRDQVGLNLVMLVLLVFIGLPGAAIVLPGLSIVAVGNDAIHVSWFGRRKQVAYDEIDNVREYAWLVPPHMCIQAGDTSLYINRWAEGLDDVYKALNTHSAPFRSATRSRSNGWQVPRRFWWTQGAGLTLIYVLIVGGIGGGAIANGPPLDDEARLLLGLTAIFFALLLGGVFLVSEVKPRVPSALQFDDDTFHFRFPFKGWRVVPRSAIQEVSQQATDQTVRSKEIEVTTKIYPLIIELDDGVKLEIDDRRAIQFGTSTHVMFAQIQEILSQ